MSFTALLVFAICFNRIIQSAFASVAKAITSIELGKVHSRCTAAASSCFALTFQQLVPYLKMTGRAFVRKTNNSIYEWVSEKTTGLTGRKVQRILHKSPARTAAFQEGGSPASSDASPFPKPNRFRQHWDSNYSSRCLVITP